MVWTIVQLNLLAGFSSVQRYGTVCSGELLSNQIQNCCIKRKCKIPEMEFHGTKTVLYGLGPAHDATEILNFSLKM